MFTVELIADTIIVRKISRQDPASVQVLEVLEYSDTLL